MSFEIVEPSSRLLSRRARVPALSTTSKSYAGLPQFWPFQPGGMPLVPTRISAQFSTTTRSAPQTSTEVTNSRHPTNPSFDKTRVMSVAPRDAALDLVIAVPAHGAPY